MGIENFAKQAAVNGIDGVLVVDMPPEEASEYCKILAAHQVDTIFLASPTTSAERLKWVETYSTGFVYYVCRAGVTGTKEDLPPQLEAEIKKLKTVIKKPICVGFGISTPQQVSAIAQWAEGVVVGSALVKCIEENPATDQALLKLENLTRRLLSALCEQRK